MRKLRLALLVLLVTCSSVFQASACPICFGESEEPMAQGLEASILFLLGLTYGLFALGGLGMFLLVRRSARLHGRGTSAAPGQG